MESDPKKPVVSDKEQVRKRVLILSSNLGLIILMTILVVGICLLLPKEKEDYHIIQSKKLSSEYYISSNSLENFDLSFLKLQNEKKNLVYSPLSIKYALEMLSEGASGKSKEQITNILGTYRAKKYSNSKNISLANALFVRDTFKKHIKKHYVNNLLNKYNAEVIYDSFITPSNLNSWVNDKTLHLIPNMFNDVPAEDFILANALGIDMEWITPIQKVSEPHDKLTIIEVDYAHRNYELVIYQLDAVGYHALDFKDYPQKIKTVEIGAVVNKYDIVKTLGEENIRKKVREEYAKWILKYPEFPVEEGIDNYLNRYIEEIDTGYNSINYSTDFSFYTDKDVKVFAKDLKEYDGTTLQYLGIMPEQDDLVNYIKNIKVEKINYLINNLKEIKLKNFKEGVITEITGYIPMFNFESELRLKEDLVKLGITDIFNQNKANLSNLTTANGSFVSKVLHKANIMFSNDGIKAAAAIDLGGYGDAGGPSFDYLYEVPIQKIDLTFDKPYLFIIRDKNTGEVWFIGSVYEPVEYPY